MLRSKTNSFKAEIVLRIRTRRSNSQPPIVRLVVVGTAARKLRSTSTTKVYTTNALSWWKLWSHKNVWPTSHLLISPCGSFLNWVKSARDSTGWPAIKTWSMKYRERMDLRTIHSSYWANRALLMTTSCRTTQRQRTFNFLTDSNNPVHTRSTPNHLRDLRSAMKRLISWHLRY